MSVTDTHKVSKVIILKSDRCLLLCREDGKGWELPGGHLNLRESYTDGAIRECLKLCKSEDVLVLNGDTFLNINISNLLNFNKKSFSPIIVTRKALA